MYTMEYISNNFVERPNNTHRWILGPLLNQPHISHQLYNRDVKFIYRLLNCHNCIVKECLTGINISNTIIGYRLAFIRYRFGINVIDTGYDVCLHNIIGTQLTIEQQNLVNCIHTLILTRSNILYTDGFSNNDINYIIDYIAIN